MNSEARQVKGKLVLGTLILGVLGAIAVSSRTARVRQANITRATETSATVALNYTAGPRPQRVIVDIRGNPGCGSATVEGEADEVQVLLSGPPGLAPTVEITASSRVLGRLRTWRAKFAG